MPTQTHNNIPVALEKEDLMYENPDGYIDIVPERPISQGRWSTVYERIITSTDPNNNRFFRIQYSRGNTEYQEDHDIAYVNEVYPHKVMTTIYKETPQDGAQQHEV